MKTLKLKNSFLVVIGSLLGSYLYLVPFFYDKKMRVGNFLERDLNFHLSRLYGIGHAFSNPINYISFKGVGHGVNYFYPWLTFYPAYIFYKLFNNGTFSLIFFLFLLTFFTFITSYYSCKAAFKNNKAAAIFSILYTFSGYRAVDVFQRCDIGEIIAITFFPIILLSFYKIIIKYDFDYWLLLSLSFSLVIYSHVLSAVFLAFTLLLLLICLWANLEYKRTLLIKISESALLTIGLTSFYWLPMLQQMRFIEINPPAIRDLNFTALDLSWLINNSLNNSINIGGAILGLVLLTVFVVSSSRLKVEGYTYRVVWLITVVLILLSTKLFPWSLLQNTPLKIIQYPWRFLEVATLLISAIGAWLLKDTKTKNIILLLFLSLSINTSISFNITKESWFSVDKNTFMSSVIGKESLDYYPIISAGQNKDSIGNKEFVVNGKTKKVPFVASDTHVTIPVSPNKDGKFLNTPFLKYLGVHATIDGKETKVKTSNRGTVQLYVPKNSKKIIITSRYTRLGNVAKLISVFSLAALIFLYLRKIYQKHDKSKSPVIKS
ncbi:hypothetical protein JCM15457_922 [Liquorilactobacillus sucicola DSM 21376 = JCM 15457]|uniref:Membrane protein 6-pyruvoyl-tetrahydropterin synthase-related domain-containing protein n=1 Tax=Liquorilactobacillus sucicola DSM 21376 = JCM 15457 TaxID=1423806 RepID=A0A023CWW0_9LACO|nr:6-pyruvoyl-tetrahydropterin synthase-related protein [Liquorilactobacillus sucicola]KRN06088.1 hypothetical protein FD15_GL001278 [Liquorilactobacillus sucicola DSM 21376 = JCM 15457]GAJ26015.1 hypothetical protein JCM15457_922 [Liquorilactobacillus sucicola DSM 21376 = JCM 15457]